MTARTFGVVLWVLVTVACSSKQAASQEPGAGSMESGDVDDALVTLVVWPARWKELDAIIAAARAKLPASAAAQLDEVLSEVRPMLASLESLVQLAARHGLDLDIPNLRLLDPSRPIIVSAFAPVDPPEMLLAAVAGRGAQAGATPIAALLRHRIVIPATNGVAMRTELSAMVRDSKLVRIGADFGDGERIVRFEGDERTVTATIVTGIGLDKLEAADRERVVAPGWKPSLHPLVASTEPSLARLHVRLDRFGEVAPRLGMLHVAPWLPSRRRASSYSRRPTRKC